MPLSVSLDCNDLAAQERFWAAALGYQVIDRTDWHVGLAPTEEGTGPLVFLNLVPEAKSVKNRMHVDWDVDDMEAEATRLEGLGAVRVGVGGIPGFKWITLQDPEGNEFCVEQVEPQR